MREVAGRGREPDHGTRRVVLLADQAEDSVRSCVHGQRTETGGLLVGAMAEDGTFLVTHATGPGPGALRGATHFRSDGRFQERCLAVLRWAYGLFLLGEWHLHPGELNVPSGWDERELSDLLAEGAATGRKEYLVGIATLPPGGAFGLRLFVASLGSRGLVVEPVEIVRVPLFLDAERAFEASRDTE